MLQYIAGKGENERRVARHLDVLGWLPFVAGTRVHLTMKWVVSFLISGPFGPHRTLMEVR